MFSSNAACTASKSSVSTNFADHPNRLIVRLNWVTVPPYSLSEVMMLHPGCMIGKSAMIWAPWPDEQQNRARAAFKGGEPLLQEQRR